MTREQAVAMVVRALRSQGKAGTGTDAETTWKLLSSFTDADRVSPWATADMALAVQEGLILGRSGRSLAPESPVSRAEAAAIIARFWQR